MNSVATSQSKKFNYAGNNPRN